MLKPLYGQKKGDGLVVTNLPIPALLPSFEEYLRVMLGRRPGTIDRYLSTLNAFSAWLSSKGYSTDPRKVGRPEVEAWMKDLYYHQGNLANITRATKLSAIKCFWRYLAYTGLIDEDPMELIPAPKIKRPMPKKFTTAQLRKLFSAPDLSTPMGIRDLAILKLMYGSGPRADEIRRLNIDDIQLDGSTAYIHYTDTKGGKERYVRLRSNPTRALLRWLTVREEVVKDPQERSLFVSMASNMPPRRLSTVGYNRILKRYAELVGISDERVFVHRMRTTFATDLYDLGFGIKEISILMGHNSVKTTERYIAISETALKKTSIPDRRWRELERLDDSEP